MSGDSVIEDHALESAAIGVGMGGSCPTCRSPIELAQEFCLECGSPVRMSARRRRQLRAVSPTTEVTTTTTTAPPASGGFPWVPFLVVLGLVGMAVAFALSDNGGNSSKKSPTESTEQALPKLTSTPSTSGNTTTVDSCDQAGSTLPTTGDTGADSGTGTGSGEQIPSLGSATGGALGGAATDPATGVPSTTSSDGTTSTTVTVDRNGVNCAGVTGSGQSTGSSSGADPFATNTTPTDTSGSDGFTTDTGATGGTTQPSNATTNTNTTATNTNTTTTNPTGATTTNTTPTSSSGDWPAGATGWTVIVYAYANDRRKAEQGAAQLTRDGFTDGGVLDSSAYKSLCPGFWVVFSGNFTSQAKATARQTALSRKGYAGLFVREVSTTTTATNCQQSPSPR